MESARLEKIHDQGAVIFEGLQQYGKTDLDLWIFPLGETVYQDIDEFTVSDKFSHCIRRRSKSGRREYLSEESDSLQTCGNIRLFGDQ